MQLLTFHSAFSSYSTQRTGAAGKEHLIGKLHSGVWAVCLVTGSPHSLINVLPNSLLLTVLRVGTPKLSTVTRFAPGQKSSSFCSAKMSRILYSLFKKEKKFYSTLKAANQIIKVLKSLMKKSKLLSKHSAWCLFPFLPTLPQCIQNLFLLCYNMFKQVLRYKQVLAPSHTEWIGCRCSPASYILPSARAFISKTHHFTYFARSQNSKVI